MKKLIYLLLIFILPMKTNAQIEKITYRGWTECYKMTNDSMEVIVNASSGGRILVLKKNGINVLWEYSAIDGKDHEDYNNSWYEVDAGRFDYGPEKVTQSIHAYSWTGPWDAEILSDTALKLTNTDTDLGLSLERIFTLYPGKPHINISMKLKNISDGQLERYFWSRTLVKNGGKAFSPLNSESTFPDQWVRYETWNPVLLTSDPDDPGVEIVDSLFTLIPEIAGNAKYGTDSHSGWMAYGYEGLIFYKTYPSFPDKPYGEPGGLRDIYYAAHNGDKHFCEIEPVSHSANLEPGDSLTFYEDWYLFDYDATTQTSFDPLLATEVIFQNLESLSNNSPNSIIDKESDSGLKVYPVPADESIRCCFNADTKGKIKIRIINSSGIQKLTHVITQANGYMEENIDVSNLSNGVYWIELSWEEYPARRLIKKIVLI